MSERHWYKGVLCDPAYKSCATGALTSRGRRMQNEFDWRDNQREFNAFWFEQMMAHPGDRDVQAYALEQIRKHGENNPRPDEQDPFITRLGDRLGIDWMRKF